MRKLPADEVVYLIGSRFTAPIIMSLLRGCKHFLLAWTVFASPQLFLLPVAAATQLPYSVPLRIGAGQFVEFSVELARNRYYQIELAFPFDNEEQRAAARKLAGDATRICKLTSDCGAAPSFSIVVSRGPEIVVREQKAPMGRNAFSATAFYRPILEVALKPGNYVVKVEVMDAPAGIINYDALIQFTTDPRTSDLDN